eukprot:882304-Pelagomonas_calceolata.AAC.5
MRQLQVCKGMFPGCTRIVEGWGVKERVGRFSEGLVDINVFHAMDLVKNGKRETANKLFRTSPPHLSLPGPETLQMLLLLAAPAP